MKEKVSKKSRVPRVLQCKICLKSGFISSYTLKAHMFSHGVIPARYKCRFCPKEYYRSDVYLRHEATHNLSRKQYYCDHCGRGFIDKRNLIQHLHIHDDFPAKTHRFTCAACGVHYCEERLLKHHIRKEHLNLNTSKPIHITKKLNETWLEEVEGTRNYVQITKVKPTMLRIKKAKLKDENVKKFQRYVASGYRGKDNNYYSRAICDYCNKEMLKKSIVPHIRERHLKVRRFHCSACGLNFNRHYQLGLHTCGQHRQRPRVEKVHKIEVVSN